MSRYQEIADDLRARIEAGEFPVGAQLPGISALQQHYGVRGLNTIRAAQQRLVEEGILRTQQGVGAFVVGTESRREVDLVAAITAARHTLGTVLEALATQRAQAQPERRVRVRVHDNDGRWAIRTAHEPWWTVSTHTKESPPVQVIDDWFGPGWRELTTVKSKEVT